MKIPAELRAAALFGLLAGVGRAWSWRPEPPLAGYLAVLAGSCVLFGALAALAYLAARHLGRLSPRGAATAALALVLVARPIEILAFWRTRYDTQPATSLALGGLALAALAAWMVVRSGRNGDPWSAAARWTGRLLLAALALFAAVTLACSAGALGGVAMAALALAAIALAAGAAGARPLLPALGLALLVLGMSAELLPAAPRPASPERPNLVLITVDTLRRDRLGLYGYDRDTTPNLDRLAADAVVFDTAVTPIPLTNPAHASLMTGLYPAAHGARNNGEPLAPGVQTLAERLAATGYDTGAVVASVVLSRRLSTLDRGFGRFDDRLPGTFGLPDHAFDLVELRLPAGLGPPLDPARMERTAEKVTDAALAWLARGRSPFFLWVHYYDPHGPYDPPEPFRGRFLEHESDLPAGFDFYTADFDTRRAILASDDERAHLADLYDGEIAFADHQIGRLLDALGEAGRFDDTVLAVTADHGESLVEHGCYYDHSICLHDPSVRIPLLLRLPRGRAGGARVAEQVRLFDLFPTLLELTVGDVPSGLDGRRLTELLAADGERKGRDCWLNVYRPEIEGDRQLAGIRRADGVKLIESSAFWNGTQRIEGRLESYDCAADPEELVDLAASRPAEVRELVQRLLERQAATEAEGSQVDPELLEMLRALGYLGGE